MSDGAATIAHALHQFLIERRAGLDDEPYAAMCEVVDHLEACLNSYGPDGLSDTELERGDAGEADFCTRFGPERIIANLPFFLDYYMIRNVVTTEDVLAAAGTTLARLATWLEERGHAGHELASIVRRQGATAAVDLPRAERMATLLTMVAGSGPSTDDRGAETAEGFMTITRVGEHALWFDDVGPVEVAPEVSRLARVGWMVSIVLASVDGRWVVREIGNVYPRSDPGFAC